MPHQRTRRDFLKSATAGMLPLSGAIGAGRAVGAAPATKMREPVPVQPEIERLVRLMEDQPRDRVIPALVREVRKGLTQRRFLAAALMTAIRNWPVDHSVYMMHAVHQLSLDLPTEDRLLPLFWSVDSMKHFKWKQKLSRVKSDRYTHPAKAARVFEAAMLESDKDTAQAAILSLARSEGPQPAFDRFWRWGAGRCGGSNIGHAAIAVANAYRTLNTVGWQHAGPVLQFLTHLGSQKTPSGLMAWPQTPVERLRPDWAGGVSRTSTVLGLLERYRDGNPQEAAKTTHARIAKGELQAASVWDAILLLASEHVVRHKQGGVTGRPLHSVTMANALHAAFHSCRKPDDRLYLLLEAVHWVTKFYDAERRNKRLRDMSIVKIPEIDFPKDESEAVAELFALLPHHDRFKRVTDRAPQDKAAPLAFALARRNATAGFLRAARRYVCRNSSVDAHELKFPVAVFENCRAVSPAWRPHIFASSVHVLHGPRQKENPAVRQARELLARRS